MVEIKEEMIAEGVHTIRIGEYESFKFAQYTWLNTVYQEVQPRAYIPEFWQMSEEDKAITYSIAAMGGQVEPPPSSSMPRSEVLAKFELRERTEKMCGCNPRRYCSCDYPVRKHYRIYLLPNEYTVEKEAKLIAAESIVFGCPAAYKNWQFTEKGMWVRRALFNF